MKKLKIWHMLVVIVILILIAGVLSNKQKDTTDRTANSSIAVNSDNTLDKAKIKTIDVKSGSGDNIGKRAFVEISKTEFEAITPESLYKWAEKNVKDKSYNWVTIIADDGQGIQFTSSDFKLATKGKIDNEGRVTKQEGLYLIGENTYKYIQE